MTPEHSPVSSVCGTLSTASKIAESESAPCSPLLLSCPALPIDLLDFASPQNEIPSAPLSPSSQSPSIVFPHSQAASEAASLPDIPLLLQPCNSSVHANTPLDPHYHVGYDLECGNMAQCSGSPSLRSTVLELGEEAILTSQFHQLDRDVKSMIVDSLKSC